MRMGAYEEWQDATVREDFAEAFQISLEILNRKGSKRLMEEWIDSCVEMLESMGKANLLPEHFRNLSVYGQREELNKIKEL